MRVNISTSMFQVMKTKMEQHLAHFKRPQILPGLTHMLQVFNERGPKLLKIQPTFQG
jgi:hypothetical protein